MDADRFDGLAQQLGSSATRRRLLRRLGALPLIAILPLVSRLGEADASRKAKRRRRKNKNPRGVPFRSTALTIRTKSLGGAYTFEAKYYTKELFGDTYFPWGYERVANPVLDRLAINVNWTPRVGVLITAVGPGGRGPDLFIDVRNEQIGFPQGAAYYRSPLDPTNGLLGTELIREQSFLVRESHQGTFDLLGAAAKATCTLKRLPDSDDFIEFDLSVEVSG